MKITGAVPESLIEIRDTPTIKEIVESKEFKEKVKQFRRHFALRKHKKKR